MAKEKRKSGATSWEQRLRAAIDQDERTIYRIAQDCGMDERQLRRFAAGERTLTLPTAEPLAKALGFDLQRVPRN